jgi:hypothetical protein
MDLNFDENRGGSIKTGRFQLKKYKFGEIKKMKTEKID